MWQYRQPEISDQQEKNGAKGFFFSSALNGCYYIWTDCRPLFFALSRLYNRSINWHAKTCIIESFIICSLYTNSLHKIDVTFQWLVHSMLFKTIMNDRTSYVADIVMSVNITAKNYQAFTVLFAIHTLFANLCVSICQWVQLSDVHAHYCDYRTVSR